MRMSSHDDKRSAVEKALDNAAETLMDRRMDPEMRCAMALTSIGAARSRLATPSAESAHSTDGALPARAPGSDDYKTDVDCSKCGGTGAVDA
jgi:hypothetical protein